MTSRPEERDDKKQKDYRKEVGIANFSSSDPHKREIITKEQEEKYINTEH
jgi:hypothetical protein